jgi:hypothetical protein
MNDVLIRCNFLIEAESKQHHCENPHGHKHAHIQSSKFNYAFSDRHHMQQYMIIVNARVIKNQRLLQAEPVSVVDNHAMQSTMMR